MGKNLIQWSTQDAMNVVGLISGTSADGVDAALCRISGQGRGQLKVELRAYLTEPYSDALRRNILSLSEVQHGHTDEICRLNFRVGETFARAAERVMEEAKLKPEELDLVGTHGQTVAHLPPRVDVGVGATGQVQRYGSTLQLGEPAVICERLGATVVSNFRTRDMAAGGQGAPLVPYVDYLLFSHAERVRAVINIGGISNITYLPANGTVEQTLAYDSGPGNMLIDGLIQMLTQGKQRYDKNGALAATGQVDGYILSELLKHPFLLVAPPKSTGREEFGVEYAQKIYEWGIRRSVRPTDTLRTVTDFTAIALAESYKKFLLPKGAIQEIIISGGGALNGVLMARLQKEFGNAPIKHSDEFGIPMKAKEAVAFAVLGRETILGRPGNLPSATGADGLRVLGQITPV